MRIPPYGIALLAALASLLLTGTTPSVQAQPVTLIPDNTVWRLHKGTAEPAPASPTAWRDAAFADTAWSAAPAPFWYGEAGLFGGTGTELTDMVNQYSTVFLRLRFQVPNPGAFESLQLHVRCDDGFIAWLNGRRIAAANAPAGDPAFNALATGNAAEPVALTPFPVANPSDLLLPGDNLLAVQVLNVSLGSSDLVFTAGLAGTPSASASPAIARISPAPGPVQTLDRITVTFTEPVQGVRADDFLVNGASATGVQGAGTTWTFSFPKPPFGPVGISWTAAHTITDFESPPQRFDVAAPGTIWTYELIDPDGPSMAHRQPPANITVASLTQVAVTFDKAVTGLDAADLTLNGIPALRVSGIGAGPFLFEFPPASAPAGPATVAWTPSHGITSDAFEPHDFAGGSWRYTVQPSLPTPALVITELMAENFTAYRDEDLDPEDWIEIWNPTAAAVNLEGWSLSNDKDEPDLWVFPSTSIPAGAHLVVFASGKDRRPGATGRFHTGYKLNPNGGTLALHGPGLPRQVVSEVTYPVQGPDHSWARENNTGAWRYFKSGSPAARNGSSSIRSAVEPVRFSTPRGFFPAPFNLALACATPGSFIRYTTNGVAPTETIGFIYSAPILIPTTRIVRAAAYAPNALPSRVETHTYLLNQTGTRLRLPALSLVTDTNHLYGRNGIMEVNPRNTTKRGAAWERPVSAELIRVDDNGGFQTDCGIRIQGGDYVRGQYNYRSTGLPFSKYSFRLYFRGEYGPGRLEFPLFPDTTQTSFDTIVLRAGMNDHSNPYLTDEFVRSLARDCGQPSAAGTFVHLFLNGIYKGYYNPCERIDVDFLRAYHGGGPTWDVMAQFGEVREGNATAFTALRNIANTANLNDPARYQDFTSRLDVTNFVDYLLPLIYVDNDDWPHNNWRAARERVPTGRYRFYTWDSEWAFGIVNGHAPSWNTIQNQLSSTAPPWGGTDIQRLYLGARKALEFRLLFADRAHRHFFNGGALTDERIRASYAAVTNRLNGVVTSFNNRIGTTWIPQRRRNVLLHLERAGLLASSNAPVFAQHGGRIPAGFPLVITNLTGAIYYTTNGSDPRLPFTATVHADARLLTTQPLLLQHPLTLRARSLQGTNWSALTEAHFELNPLDAPLQFTEINYHPIDGDAFEFLEFANLGPLPIDVSGFSLNGVTFRFPDPTPPMPPGAHWVLANDSNPSSFTARHPATPVAGWFDGSLSNSGERLELVDPSGRVVASAEYKDAHPWPTGPDGQGPTLERLRPDADPGSPDAWAASTRPGGSPGSPSPATSTAPPRVLLNEIFAPDSLSSEPDWIELANPGTDPVLIGNWSLTDSDDPRRFTFPPTTTLAPGAFLRVWCTPVPVAPGLHTGFGLDPSGETVALYDAATNRIDVVRFGPLVPGFSLGRLGQPSTWTLTEPTPTAPNEPALLARSPAIAINEWLANPIAGDPDWVELHNTDPSLPAALDGLYLATSNAVHRIASPVFIPPSGFVQLIADSQPGPDHLDLRFPSGGGTIVLHDRDGSELQRVTYGAQVEGIALGRIPDGTGTPVPFPGTASPGTSNYTAFAAGPRLNEFMARNTGSVRAPSGLIVDWLEIRNPSGTAFNLEGAGLGLGSGDGPDWTFPAGSSIPANGFLVVWCDGDSPASTVAEIGLNFGRSLSADGGRITLFNAIGQILDAVHYGAQLPDLTSGRTGNSWSLLLTPTPGTANAAPASLSDPAAVRLNEWLANGASTTEAQDPDWFELFNPDPRPVDLGAHRLTDDPSRAGVTNHVIAPLTFIPPAGHIIFFADPDSSTRPNSVDFRLDSWGETLRLYSPSGTLIDSVDLLLADPGVSEGRLPDGASTIVRFPGSASPGTANWQVHPDLVINEILAHTDPPFTDAIELLSTSDRPVDLSGWYLSNDASNLRRIRLPSGTVIEPRSFRVLHEPVFNPPGTAGAFTLNSARGDDVWLSESDRTGVLTGRRAHAPIGASANAESWGRHRTSVGWDFTPLSRTTFGKDQPRSIEEFRLGAGLPNAYPRVGPVVITEIHYRPVATTSAAEDPALEFIELQNLTSIAVPLAHPSLPLLTWRLRGAVRFDFPQGHSLPPGGRAIIVPFAPTNTPALDAFNRATGFLPGLQVFGPFDGRLANEGEELRLERPDDPQSPSDSDAGFVPWLLVDRVHYLPAFPWPDIATTRPPGLSLQRRRTAEHGNDPANWISATPTPGTSTLAPSTDRDLDGLPNDWETTHGLNPDNPADALLDADADGRSNLAEYRAGTDPRSAASVLAVSVSIEPGAGPTLRFHAIAGRSYSVLHRDAAAGGAWRTFTDIPAETSDHPVSVPLGPVIPIPRFYQVVTPATSQP